MYQSSNVPHRDPETGQFVSGSEYADIEVASFSVNAGVTAADLSGATGFDGGDQPGFEGAEILDYDDIVDRNEELHLLSAEHRIDLFVNSTETADGTVLGAFEVSASPSRTDVTTEAGAARTADLVTGTTIVGDTGRDDTIDVVGRPLVATGHAPFSDSSTGVGGGGSAGEDTYDSTVFPTEMGRFHPRDELFLNGQFTVWNIDDAGIHAQLTGQHVYGVIEE